MKVTLPPQAVATAGTGGLGGGGGQATMLNEPLPAIAPAAVRTTYVCDPTLSASGPMEPVLLKVPTSVESTVSVQLAHALLTVAVPPQAVATTGVGGTTGTTYLFTKPQFQTFWPSLNETFRS